MMSRSHVRLAVLSAVAALAVSSLTAAQGQVRSGEACTSPTGQSTAAEALGWGTPAWCAEFNGALNSADWVVYDSPGHAGNGRRSPGQLLQGNGALYLYGRADGTTAGLASRHSQTYGRWETRIRLYQGAGSYHPVALLWPQEGGGNVKSATGEEIDFLEVINDPGRQRPNFFLHTPQGQEQANAAVDMTAWHTYAVENTANGVVGYLDGKEWFRSANATHSPMSACLQLDWFPGQGDSGDAWMEVDWLHIYSLNSGGGSGNGSGGSGNGSGGSGGGTGNGSGSTPNTPPNNAPADNRNGAPNGGPGDNPNGGLGNDPNGGFNDAPNSGFDGSSNDDPGIGFSGGSDNGSDIDPGNGFDDFTGGSSGAG
ncbi:glycoside hydrolase family 16 protein [Streptosporangium sp. NPDC051022]|uniref:glycoside hydrolase family 16 protein n=1 Tax=Streptosporangium sp. NPDC051022 TaxID=3155752 RepID=UPI00341FA81E